MSSLYALSFDKKVWEFPVGLESLEVSYPARSEAVPTLAAAYLDFFGPGVGTINISASTGWGNRATPRGAVSVDGGKKAMAALLTLYKQWTLDVAAADNPMLIPMTFIDSNQSRVFLVAPDRSGLRITTHKSSPLISRFSLGLIILRDLTNGRVEDAIYLGKFIETTRPNVDATRFQTEAQQSIDRIGSAVDTPQNYEVQEGDTIASIAQDLQIPVGVLMDANGIRQRDRIEPGLVLRIPIVE